MCCSRSTSYGLNGTFQDNQTFIDFRFWDHPIFGTLTSFFVICPVIAYVVLDLINYKRCGKTQNGKWGFVWQLPLVKLKKYWEYLEKLGTIMNDEEYLKKLKSEVKEKDEDEDLNEKKSWELEQIFNKFSESGLTEESSKFLGKIWRSAHTATFDGCLYDEVFIVMDNYKKYLKIQASNLESKVAASKMIEVFCESGPQFILQVAIILRNSSGSSLESVSSFVENNPGSATIKILTLTTSFASLLLGASYVFKFLPHIKLHHQERRTRLYSWKSHFVVFPSLFMVVGPRLLGLALFFGSCQKLPGIIVFLILFIVYLFTFLVVTLSKYRKFKDINQSESYRPFYLWAFFSAIFSPCIVIHPKTQLLFLSSIASAIAHLCLLLLLIHFPNYLNSPLEPFIFKTT